MAGGTGGHIFPGLAVAQALRTAGVAVSWLGASGGMECRKVPPHGIELDEIRISGLRGKGLASWLTLPLRLARAVRDAGRVLDARRPACAVSFGGYVAGPGGIAAWLRGVPLVVHEQNRIPGLTNKTLARVAQARAAGLSRHVSGPGARTCGNPVRGEVAALAAAGRTLGRPQRPGPAAGDRRQPGRTGPEPGLARGLGPACRASRPWRCATRPVNGPGSHRRRYREIG